jgi:ribosomal protein L37AE/L43A
MVKKIKPVKYFCHWCKSLVEPIRIGRAHYDCPKCKTDMTIDILYQSELQSESNFSKLIDKCEKESH